VTVCFSFFSFWEGRSCEVVRFVRLIDRVLSLYKN
jgi:hypothetical protein